MKILWKILTWISIACGLIAYSMGWIAIFSNSVFFGVATEFWFYDSIAAGVFGIFFLMYGIYGSNSK